MSLLRRRNFWLGAGLLVAAAAAGAVYVLPPWPSFLNIVFDLMAFAVTLLGGLALFSQFVLPVQNSRERRKVFDHFMNFVTGQAGPVLFVKDGQLVGAKDELRRYGHGVACDRIEIVVSSKPSVEYTFGERSRLSDCVDATHRI